MPDTSLIIEQMVYENLRNLNPLNTTNAAPYTITYQYAGRTEPANFPSAGYTGWTPFTEAEKDAFEKALAQIAAVINVSFVEVTGASDPTLDVGKVSLSGTTTGRGGYNFSYTGDTIIRYDSFAVFKNTVNLADGTPTTENLLLHELGHALGLKHSHDHPALPADKDNSKYTVMSYVDNPDNGERSDGLELYDIIALQRTWGEAANNAGDTVYSNPRNDTVDAIWDTGGIDRFDAGRRTNDVKFDLREGNFSTFDTTDDVVIAFNTSIENATGGAGNDLIVGNDLDNVMVGSGGNDTLKGLKGSDRLVGNAGDDRLLGGNANDTLLGGNGKDILKGGKGNDKQKGGKGHDTLDGQNSRDKLLGQGGKDTLLGGKGNDLLKGGAGRDVLNGQKGNDRLFGGGDADTIKFKRGGGNDTFKDFENGIDTVRFIGLGGDRKVMNNATQDGDDVVFDFGNRGSLTVEDTTIGQIRDDILT